MASGAHPFGGRDRTVTAAYHSRPVGDVVLSNPPPYRQLPWLGMGVPLVSALLEQHGISSRIVRFLDDPFETPREVSDASDEVMWGNPPREERLARMRMLADRYADFFERLVSRLLEGPERVFGFSAWRQNADAIVELARRLKERRPEALVVIGGPEATASCADFHLDWIDVVVMTGGEGALGPVFRALLEGRVADAGEWDKVWVNPRHGAPLPLVRKRAEAPPMPRIDYAPIVPLFLGDPRPVIPVLLNIGCPFHCSFCTNGVLYPKAAWGSPERLFEEMMQISTVWKDSFPDGEMPRFRLTLCDATINAQPEQFEKLCELMASAEWPSHRPHADGHIVLSGRITPPRVELALAAGFDSFFFGLETASRRLRATVKKPGTIESVSKALEVLRDTAGGAIRVTCGVIVGWPGETEEEFYETVSFLDWAATLGVFDEISVNPLLRLPSAEDMGALADAEGGPYTLHWRLPGPAGTPEVRARRTFYILEHFAGILPANMGVPTRLIEQMFERRVESFWERWHATHDRQKVDFAEPMRTHDGNGGAAGARERQVAAATGPAPHELGRDDAPASAPDAATASIDGPLRASIESIVDEASGGAWRLVSAMQAEGYLDLLVDSFAGPVAVRVEPAVGGRRYYRVIGDIGYSYLLMRDELRATAAPDKLHAPDMQVLEQFIRGAHPTLRQVARFAPAPSIDAVT